MKNIYKSILVLPFIMVGSVSAADTQDLTTGPVTTMTVVNESGNEVQAKVAVTEFITSTMQPTTNYNASTEADDEMNAAAISE